MSCIACFSFCFPCCYNVVCYAGKVYRFNLILLNRVISVAMLCLYEKCMCVCGTYVHETTTYTAMWLYLLVPKVHITINCYVLERCTRIPSAFDFILQRIWHIRIMSWDTLELTTRVGDIGSRNRNPREKCTHVSCVVYCYAVYYVFKYVVYI